jgi:hypothetical protein
MRQTSSQSSLQKSRPNSGPIEAGSERGPRSCVRLSRGSPRPFSFSAYLSLTINSQETVFVSVSQGPGIQGAEQRLQTRPKPRSQTFSRREDASECRFKLPGEEIKGGATFRLFVCFVSRSLAICHFCNHLLSSVLGFRGKWAMHTSQIAYRESHFGLSDVLRFRHII